MRIRYDESVDALYIQLSESKIGVRRARAGYRARFDAQNQVVGVEVLDVKRRVPKADLEQLKPLIG